MSSTGKLKQVLRLEAAIVFIASLVAFSLLDYSWWLFVALLFVPDIFMIGYIKNTKLGAFIYNVGHTYITPAAVALLAYLLQANIALPVAVIWVAHIGLDRSLGYGLKYKDAFTHTHLGIIGKSPKK